MGSLAGVDPNGLGNLPNVYADNVRGAIGQDIRGDGSNALRNIGYYGFQAVNGAGDSLLRAVAAGPYSLTLSASATFNDTMIDATKKGASTGEAVLLGVLNAGIETATEKILLDNLLDNLGKNPGNWMDILQKAGGQGLIECTTEELSFIGTTLTEAAILRQNSGYATTVRELRNSGLSEQEAIAKANLQVLEEAKEIAITSMLSGEMSSVGSSVIGAMRNPIDPNTVTPPDIDLRRDAFPEQAGTPEGNGWRNAAELARQEDLSVMDALDRAGLQGSEALARANPQAYGQSFQEALKGGASYDQALIQATSNAVMKAVGRQIPMDTLLYNIGGDPNKAVSVIGGALNRAGINMTPGELNLLGIVAAEASAYQRDASFQTKVALEMLKGPKEEAWTAASETLWREATDRVIEHGIADFISSLDKGTNLRAGEIYSDLDQEAASQQSAWEQVTEDVGAVMESENEVEDADTESPKTIDNAEESDTMDSRGMAMSLRNPKSHILTEEEIQSVLTEARALGIDEKLLRFNQGSATCFFDDDVCIYIRGDILPDPDGESARDRMSIRAVLAHEYYGHYLHHPSEYPIGDWRDEFRASYEAAVKAPNLTAEDRAYLMIDAYDRAREARQFLEYDETARRIIYGYEED